MKIQVLIIALLFSATTLMGQNLISARSKPFLGIGATNSYNTFLGLNSGLATQSSTGVNNVFVGEDSGLSNTSGSGNVFVGQGTGVNFLTGNFNTFIGYNAGNDLAGYQGSGNVYIGYMAGANFASNVGNNRLIINNSSSRTPLIRGTFGTSPSSANLIIYGKTGITTSSSTFTFPSTTTYPNYGLFVAGGILAEEVTVSTGWADYVFDDSYKLKSLQEVEQYILENNHLPNVPSASEIETKGMNVGNIARIQQEKIEELTLYIIEQDKKASSQSEEIKVLNARIAEQDKNLANQAKAIDEIRSSLKAKTDEN